MSQAVEMALAALVKGDAVVVIDDADREDEGDLLVAASLCSEHWMAFIVRHTSGIVCVPMPPEEARRLHLDPMVANNDAPLATAFTVSVDYRVGLTTGISAAERAATCRALASGKSGPADFVRPGHVFPLVARKGGVLFRAGHTEAAVDLCRAAGLPPVGVIGELMNDDGTVMKGPGLVAFAEKHGLVTVTIDDIIAWRQARETLVERVSTFSCDSPIGALRGFAYRTPFDPVYHFAFVHGHLQPGQPLLTRFHRPNVVADIFAGAKAANAALAHFSKAGAGVLVYLRDGAAGVPVAPLSASAGDDRDRVWREVGVGAQILRDLGVHRIRNLSITGRPFAGLAGYGIEIAETVMLFDSP